jgi:hypothetical protein
MTTKRFKTILDDKIKGGLNIWAETIQPFKRQRFAASSGTLDIIGTFNHFDTHSTRHYLFTEQIADY